MQVPDAEELPAPPEFGTAARQEHLSEASALKAHRREVIEEEEVRCLTADLEVEVVARVEVDAVSGTADTLTMLAKMSNYVFKSRGIQPALLGQELPMAWQRSSCAGRRERQWHGQATARISHGSLSLRA